MKGMKKKHNMKKANNQYYERQQCERCKRYFSINDIDPEDGQHLCGECEQEIWKE
jgi:formylmethanofuran dehydrogenase subunit E